MVKLDNLFKLMEEQGINAKRISDATGISTGNISDWKSGRSMPSAAKLDILADYLDCSVDFLLGRDEQKKPTPINEGRLSETALRFAELVDRLTRDRQELLRCQIQAWIEQDRKRASAAPQSAGEKDLKSDP